MNERARQQKIARFLADPEMSAHVKDVLLSTFLKERKSMDVHTLAAKSLAIDMLQEAFRDMERYRVAPSLSTAEGQVGL